MQCIFWVYENVFKTAEVVQAEAGMGHSPHPAWRHGGCGCSHAQGLSKSGYRVESFGWASLIGKAAGRAEAKRQRQQRVGHAIEPHVIHFARQQAT